LVGLNWVGRNVVIKNNDALTNLDGMGVTGMWGELLIEHNNALTNLDGLEHLHTIASKLDINNNAALTSVSGLFSLTSLGWGLFIEDNESLCRVAELRDLINHIYEFWDSPFEGGEYDTDFYYRVDGNDNTC
jgi:hypothetical protein